MKYPYMVNFEGKYYPAGTDVPVGDSVVVSLTDNVPDGALEANADGSVSAYDAEDNVVGTVPAEEVAELGQAVRFEAQEKPKRGRKAKEE